jgi:hypothetical protein
MPGIDTSNIRHWVSASTPDARKASAEANGTAVNPNVCSSPGSDSRDDTSSSTTDIKTRFFTISIIAPATPFSRSGNRKSISQK